MQCRYFICKLSTIDHIRLTKLIERGMVPGVLYVAQQFAGSQNTVVLESMKQLLQHCTVYDVILHTMTNQDTPNIIEQIKTIREQIKLSLSLIYTLTGIWHVDQTTDKLQIYENNVYLCVINILLLITPIIYSLCKCSQIAEFLEIYKRYRSEICCRHS